MEPETKINEKLFRLPTRTGRPVNRLKKYRKLAGISRQEIAAYLGIHKSSVANVENYNHSLKRENWYKLAKLLKCPADVLEGFAPEKNLPELRQLA